MKLVLAGAAVLLLAFGCNPELDEYRQVEVGKPLATRGVLPPASVAAKGLTPSARFQYFGWPLPSVIAMKTYGVVVDPTGSVVAKHYSEFAIEHWLAAQLGAMDWRLEVLVPPKYFHETPSDWGDLSPGSNSFRDMEDAARVFSQGLPENQRGADATTADTFEEYVQLVDIPMNPKRLAAGVLAKVSQKDAVAPIDIHRDVDLSGVDLAKLDAAHAKFSLVRKGEQILLRAEAHSPRNAEHVVAYLNEVLRRICQATGPQQPWETPPMLAANFEMVMFVGGRTTWPSGIANHPKDFAGLTKEGFDRTIDFGDGGTARIRNLGGGRISLEFTFFRIIDPFFIIPMAECSGKSSERHGTTITGKSEP